MSDHPHAEAGLERLVLFTDAVIAIAITLLVLELKLPHLAEHGGDAALRGALLDITPKLVAYFTTFLVIGQFWVAHHKKFLYVRGFDGRLLWLNMLFLMGIAFLPFASALSAEHAGPTAWTVYAGSMAFSALATAATWAYALKAGFVDPNAPAELRRRGITGPLAMAGVFALSIVLMHTFPKVAGLSLLLIFVPVFHRRAQPLAASLPSPVPSPLADPAAEG